MTRSPDQMGPTNKVESGPVLKEIKRRSFAYLYDPEEIPDSVASAAADQMFDREKQDTPPADLIDFKRKSYRESRVAMPEDEIERRIQEFTSSWEDGKAMDYRSGLEHNLIGSSSLPTPANIPLALISGALTIEEINLKRREKGKDQWEEITNNNMIHRMLGEMLPDFEKLIGDDMAKLELKYGLVNETTGLIEPSLRITGARGEVKTYENIQLQPGPLEKNQDVRKALKIKYPDYFNFKLG